jgi:hypothetical protein
MCIPMLQWHEEALESWDAFCALGMINYTGPILADLNHLKIFNHGVDL